MFTMRNKNQPPEVFYKKNALTNALTQKTPALESLFNQIAGLQVCYFIKKRLQQRFFSINIVKFLKTSILKKACERLLLDNAGPIFLFIYMKIAKQVFL